MTGLARRVAGPLLRLSAVNRAARAFARMRGHRLVLVYHRLGAPVAAGCEIVPSVAVDTFKAQLQALGEVVDLVTIDEVLVRDSRRTGDRQRPVVAVTFDDDLPSHVEYALPVLREFGVPAAFFLSGRALHGLGAYWFQYLEALLINYGVQRTAELLRVPKLPAGQLVLACEDRRELRSRVIELASGLPVPDILQPDGIEALAAARMTVGFHTVVHDRLPDLDDRALEHALSHGREDLAMAARTGLRYFAYPHGKADERAAGSVRRAGFDAAFTGLPRPVRSGDDVYRVGRWEPGPLGVDDLLVNLAIRLHRAGRPIGKALS